MAWSNPNPSVKQVRNQPTSYPSGGNANDANQSVKDWYARESEAAAAVGAAGEHRTPSSGGPGG
jgi:hypothetical protein